MRTVPRLAVAALFLGAVVFLWQKRSRSESRPPPPFAGGVAPGENPTLPHETAASIAAALPKGSARERSIAEARAFDDWLLAWRRTDPASRAALASRGPQLAADRRRALAHLIQTDPQLALALAVDAGVRSELPPEVQALLEEQIDTRGDLDVGVRCYDAAHGHEEQVVRVAHADGRRWHAHVYGPRRAPASRANVPLHGIAIDHHLALRAEPYRVLAGAEPDYTPAAGELAVRVGREIRALKGARALADVETGDGFNAQNDRDPQAAVTVPVGWNAGVKRILVVAVDYSDFAGTRLTEPQITGALAGTNAFYDELTGGRTSFAITVFPTVFQLAHTRQHYSDSPFGLNEMEDEMKKFALDYDVANGGTGLYDPNRADRWIIVHPNFTSGNVAAGFGLIGKRGIFLNDIFVADVLAHELGHNAGVYHSHTWKTSSGTPYAITGEHEEYGDPFDLMGAMRELSPASHFNAVQKASLGFLPDDAVAAISGAGTHRIFRHDDRNAAGLRALRIPGLPYDYWLEYRQAAPAFFSAAQAAAFRNSVQVRWGAAPYFASGDGPYLLDLHPDAAHDFHDAGLAIGETYTDTEFGVTLTPLSTGGTAPNEYIDVKIEFGALPGNGNPALTFPLSNPTLTARVDAQFSASATDPDGDAVQYRWDFGDRRTNPITATQTHRWLKGGSYTVSAVAIDGKGGHSLVSYPVTVADPFLAWTRRAQEIVTPNPLLTGLYAGGRFVFSGFPGQMVTSTDGITWTPITVASNLFVSDLAHNGTRFVAVGRGNATTLWSNDGTTWQSVALPAGVSDLWAVAWNGSRFVAVGEGGSICTSTDGQTWTKVTSPTTDQLRCVAFANNQWVAGGANGRILSSPDGLTWTNHSLAVAHLITTMVRLGNLWYATQGASIWTSPDAATWTQQTIRSPRTYVNKAAVMADGTLVAPTTGKLAWTQDLLPWESAVIDPARPEEAFQAVAVGNGLVVVAGPEGRIYTSGTPTVAAPILRDLRPAPEVVAGRLNPIAVAGPTFTKLELLVDGSKVGENDGSGPLSWTPARFGTYQVAVRGTLPGGTTITSNAESVTAYFSEWTWTSPLPFPVRLNAGVRAGDRWYLAGGGGGLFSLDDAGYATRVALGTNEPFRDIDYANGRFIAVSSAIDFGRNQSGYGLWTSSDGVSWLPFSATRGLALDGVTYGPGLWVAVGTGQIQTSPDGLTWTTRTLPTAGAILNDIAYGGGQFLAVGGAGTILASSDGVTWSARTSGSTAMLNSAAYANNWWVVVGNGGEILRSPDGVTWSREPSGLVADFVAVARVSVGFVAVTNLGHVRISPDGTIWPIPEIPLTLKPMSGIATDATNSLLLGTYGEYLKSANSSTWVEGGGSVTNSYAKVVYANKRFVAAGRALAGGARVAVSGDGTTWTQATISGPGQLNAIAWSGQQFVAAGSNGQIHTSSDGLTWTLRTSGFTGGPNVDLNGAASAEGSHVVVGALGTIVSSADGVAWTSRTSGTTALLRDVTYGPNGYIAVGASGVILASADGVTWTPRSSGVTSQLNVVTHAAGLGYIAGGAQGVVLVSSDGGTWAARNAAIAFNEVNAVVDTPQGVILAAGLEGTVLYSDNAQTWIRDALPVDRRVTGFAVGPAAIVGVGEQGLLLVQGRAQPTSAPTVTARAVNAGGTAIFSAGPIALADATYQWQRNGANLSGAIAPLLALEDVQPADAGIYAAVVTRAALSATSEPAMLGVNTTQKLVGPGTEFPNILHGQTGYTYDQLLLGGPAAAFTADSALNQITRLSYIDLTNDIVQVEFSGPGTVSLVLEGSSGPGAPLNYSQPTNYMKGHAGIVVTGATVNTHLSVFSVGRGTAVNQGLFSDNIVYDGMADISFIAIQSADGKFGGLRTANARYWNTKGITGVYAPGVQFTGPVFVHDINAQQDATPVFVIGSAVDRTWITGGDLEQANGRAVRVSGLTQLRMADGVTSHYLIASPIAAQYLLAQTNRARLERDGVDVTAEIVVNP